MSAFDSSTETPSVSFTNSYGTAVMQPSASTQYVYGYRRTTVKRYLEYYINDAGGDPSKLWVGLGNTPTAAGIYHTGELWGSTGKYVLWLEPNLNGSPGTNDLSSISTGDVYMFSVDFGGGTDHSGTQRVFTTTNGTGGLLLPVCIDAGKNGSWGALQVGLYQYAAGGISGYDIPLVVRESTSASSAVVSLRVVTTSFAYTIPTGFIAWGDGSDELDTSNDADVHWDPAKVSSQMSLSGSNYYAVAEGPIAAPWEFVLSSALPTTGKRVVEVHTPETTGNSWGWGLSDDTASITASAYQSANRIGASAAAFHFFRRSVNMSLSTTLSTLPYNFYGEQPSIQMFIDFDAARMWATGGFIASGGTFVGDKNAAGIADPYTGVDGLTFTSSVGLRLYAEFSGRTPTPKHNFLNVGQVAFAGYPLLPGWKSMNGGREVYGVGATWDTTVGPASSSYESSNLTVRTNAVCVIQGSDVKNAGKYYFEIFNQGNLADPPFASAFGLRPGDATTITAATAAQLVDSGLFFDFTNHRKSRYGVSTTFTTTGSTTGGGTCQIWIGIAVDFDMGYIWAGIWNKKERVMNWSSDPALGLNPDMTFTASTTLRIAATNVARTVPVILVAEDTNVLGLPTTFKTWNGTRSTTATPSGVSSGTGVLWPYGVMT